MADSLPAPGPLTLTSMYRMPNPLALDATSPAASWEAKGVPFRAPLKPAVPELAQHNVSPFWSVIVIIVLLKVDWTKANPKPTSFLTFFFFVFFLGFAIYYSLIYS